VWGRRAADELHSASQRPAWGGRAEEDPNVDKRYPSDPKTDLDPVALQAWTPSSKARRTSELSARAVQVQVQWRVASELPLSEQCWPFVTFVSASAPPPFILLCPLHTRSVYAVDASGYKQCGHLNGRVRKGNVYLHLLRRSYT
jgi:hypothetical protein